MRYILNFTKPLYAPVSAPTPARTQCMARPKSARADRSCALTPDKCASARREAVLFHISAKKYRDQSEFLCRAPMENAASGIDFSCRV